MPNNRARGARTRRGGKGLRRGAAPRGAGMMARPSIEAGPDDIMANLEDLPRRQAMETPKIERKRRRLPSPDQRFVTCSPAASMGSAPHTPHHGSQARRRRLELPPAQERSRTPAEASPRPVSPVQRRPSTPAEAPPRPVSPAQRRPSTPAEAPPRPVSPAQRRPSPPAEAPPRPVSPAQRRPSTPAEAPPRPVSPVQRRPSPPAEAPPRPVSPAQRRPSPPAEAAAGPSGLNRRVWRPLRDIDITDALLGYDDDSEPEDEALDPILMPRSRLLIFGDDDDDDETDNEQAPVQAVINLDWEPNPELLINPPAREDPLEPAHSDPIELDKFKFDWRSFRVAAQEDPLERREQFDDSACGPTQVFASPYDAFTQIWDRHIVEHIITETNNYAQQCADLMMREGTLRPTSRITRWANTTVDEIYRLFGVLLAMGMVAKSRIIDYWSIEDLISITPGFRRAMSLNRFKILIKYLHFSDSSILPTPTSRLHRIQPILDHLNTKFQSLYVPYRNLALDESLTLYKGWLSIKQFISKKAAGVGVKTYEVCESATGYLYRFEVHADAHESTTTGPLSGFIPTLVLRLLDGLENKGHTVWMDNFYNSPALARELKTRGFDCVGTLRPNRQFVPIELATLNLTDMAPGEVRGCSSGDVDLLVWRDKKKVNLISTYHGLATVMDNRTQTLKPSIIPDYNVCMGGVDSKDQQLAAYPVERTRQRIWYKKLFRRLLNVSVLNSYILYKHHSPIPHRKFREILI